MTLPAATDDALWQELVEKDLAFNRASRAFLTEAANRAAVLRDALRGPDRGTALFVAPCLKIEELKELFGPLVFLASFSHGSIGAVRDLIRSLPREWVLERIEQEAEPLLREGTYDEYRRFLELYEELGAPDLVRRLALRAAAHADPDVREAGEDYLSKAAQEAVGPRA
jgi:hypothetical protein